MWAGLADRGGLGDRVGLVEKESRDLRIMGLWVLIGDKDGWELVMGVSDGGMRL